MVRSRSHKRKRAKRNRRKAGVWGGAELRIDRTVMQKSGIPRRIDESQQCDTYIPFRTTWFKAKQHHSNVGRNVPSETRSTALHTLAGATSTRQGLRDTALLLNIWPNCLPLCPPKTAIADCAPSSKRTPAFFLGSSKRRVAKALPTD